MRALFLAVRRRPDLRGSERAISYAGMLLPVLIAILIANGIGIVVLHLVLPWPAARLAMLTLGVLGTLWLAGFLASVHVYPHAVGDEELRIRFAAMRDCRLRLQDVTRVHAQRRSWELAGVTAVVDGDLVVPVMSETTVVVELAPGTSVSTSGSGQTVSVRRIFFAADDASAAVQAISRHMTDV